MLLLPSTRMFSLSATKATPASRAPAIKAEFHCHLPRLRSAVSERPDAGHPRRARLRASRCTAQLPPPGRPSACAGRPLSRPHPESARRHPGTSNSWNPTPGRCQAPARTAVPAGPNPRPIRGLESQLLDADQAVDRTASTRSRPRGPNWSPRRRAGGSKGGEDARQLRPQKRPRKRLTGDRRANLHYS